MRLHSGDSLGMGAACVALLDEADVVVTNPPFSLFREYMALLMEHKKQFLIVGNMNAVTYKEVFPLIKGNKVRSARQMIFHATGMGLWAFP